MKMFSIDVEESSPDPKEEANCIFKMSKLQRKTFILFNMDTRHYMMKNGDNRS
jgi:hypothetical protein